MFVLIITAMMIKLKHAAKELNVSERFLRQLIAEGRIPFYRLPKRTLRVDLKEIRDYMNTSLKMSISSEREIGKCVRYLY